MSTNAVSICKSIDLSKITRIEASIRYKISFHGNKPSGDLEDSLVHCLHDRMTQCRYMQPVETFELDIQSEPVYHVDVIGQGRSALEKANKDLGTSSNKMSYKESSIDPTYIPMTLTYMPVTLTYTQMTLTYIPMTVPYIPMTLTYIPMTLKSRLYTRRRKTFEKN